MRAQAQTDLGGTVWAIPANSGVLDVPPASQSTVDPSDAAAR
ncbi:hypothetical protein [Frankia sp. Cr2]|nr:hypothetical protein [Frankia sp. Cr2]